MFNPKKKPKDLSLLEILVVVALLGLFLGVFFRFFSGGTRNFDLKGWEMEKIQNCLILEKLLKKNLDGVGARMIFQGGRPLTQEDPAFKGEKNYLKLLGNGEELTVSLFNNNQPPLEAHFSVGFTQNKFFYTTQQKGDFHPFVETDTLDLSHLSDFKIQKREGNFLEFIFQFQHPKVIGKRGTLIRTFRILSRIPIN